MAAKYYLIYDNEPTGQNIQASNNQITITGNHLRLMEANFMSDEDINHINELNKPRKKLKLKVAVYSILDSMPYISILCYFIAFFFISLLGDFGIISFSLAVFSILL